MNMPHLNASTRLLMVAGVLATLAACGNKGPLVHPPSPADTATPAPPPPSSTDPTIALPPENPTPPDDTGTASPPETVPPPADDGSGGGNG